jgi:hypothetical protein
MFGHVIENIQSYLAGDPVRVINSAVLESPSLRKS